MHKYIIKGALVTCLITVLTGYPAKAQQINFSYSPATESFAADQFRIDLFQDEDESGSLRLRNSEVIFGDGSAMLSGFRQLSISEDRAFAGAIFTYGEYVSAEIYRSDGSLIHRISRLAEYDPDDPSIRLYMLNDGSFIYRDNIAGFTYYDERGESVFRASNSSGSPDGETISELAATPHGQSIVLFNPEIYIGDRIDSRIQMASFDGETRTIASFTDRSISSVQLHPSGRLLLVHKIEESSGVHKGKVLTNRGDVLTEIDYENDEIIGLELSDDGRFVTARASGRAIVHSVTSGERLGSASFGERVLTARYMPDEILAVLTGSISGNEYDNLRAHMIDVSARRVARKESSLTVHGHELFLLALDFQNEGEYKLLGGNREVIIRHNL